MSLSLDKQLQGTWEKSRGRLRTDLERVETAINRLSAAQASWPVGGVLVTTVNTNPYYLLGFGVWALVAAIAPGGGDNPRTLYIWEQQSATDGQPLNLPAGPTGAQGPAGRTVVWWNDTGAPAAGVGSIGDMYLDDTTGEIYGPKAPAGWGTPIATIMGPQGDKGDKGDTGDTGATGDSSTWLTGAGVPGAGLGEDGDMYLDSGAHDVYGPKTGGAWGSSVCNIQGPAGTPGTGTAISRVVQTGDTYTVEDTQSVIVMDYYCVEGTGVLAIEGDGVLAVL